MISPKVSVIVPVYNREDTISRCLDSLLFQSLNELEIIVIDDGSTDRSLSLCEKYTKIDDRVTLIKQKNTGVSSARNKGLEIAKGEYIAFCDSDDWTEHNTYEEAYFAAKARNIDLVVFGFVNEIYNYKEHITITNGFKQEWLFKGKDEVGRSVLEMEKKSFFEAPWNKLYKRSIISKHQIWFNPSISLHEDFLFNVEFVKYINTCLFLDKVFYHIVGRDRPSLSKQVLKNPIEIILSNVNAKRALLIDFGLDDKEYIDHLESKLVISFSGLLPTIYRKGGGLKRKERISMIRQIMDNLKGKRMDTSSFQSKISYILLKTKSPLIIDTICRILSSLRYASPKSYIWMRNSLNRSHIKRLKDINGK